INERDVLVKTASGDHPFLTQPLSCFQDADNVYFVMSMYAQNLAQLIFPADAAPLAPQQLQLFAAELLLGLQSLHELGIVHRDLKPENVLVTPNGHIAVADFGLAKQFAAGPVGPEMEIFTGTLRYMSPNIVKRNNRGRGGSTNIWSLGCVVRELVTG
ncbi:kinase-like protein, partial [Athelia psychrophila]